MVESKNMNQVEASVTRIETTIGELVEALTGIALESSSSEQEAYVLTSIAVNDLLDRSSRRAS